MANQSVFISPNFTMEQLEEKLGAAYGVIKNSPDISSLCSLFAIRSLCATVLPVCRTPEETNHLYFQNKNRAKTHRFVTKKAKKSNAKKQQKTKAPNTIKIVPTENVVVFRTTTPRTRTIEYYGANSYYEEPYESSRKKRFVDIESIKNG
jgi:hypothetical protein